MLKLAGELIEGQLADHKADIDAHMPGMLQKPWVGHYYLGWPVKTIDTYSPIASVLYALLLFFTRPVTIDRIAIDVTNYSVGDKVRMGVYNDNGSAYPGALLSDEGEATITGNGILAISISPALAIPAGYVWFVSNYNTRPNGCRRFNGTPLGLYQDDANLFGSFDSNIDKAYTYGALPDPYPSGGTKRGSTYLTLPRIASLA